MTYGRLLKTHPDFRRLWAGQVVSEVGDWLNNIAVFALVIELAGRGNEGFAVALYGLARHLPLFLFGPVAGVVTDRANRRRVMIFADIARAVLTFGFFAANAYASLPIIYVVGASLLAVSTFFNAAKRASVRALVPERDALLAANSLSASTTAATIAVGSALGGIIATFAGRETVFTLNVVTFIISAYFISRIATPLDARTSETAPEEKIACGEVGTTGETFAGGNLTSDDVARDNLAGVTIASRRTSRVDLRSLVRRGYGDFRRGLSYVREDGILTSVFIVAAGWGLGNGAARALYSLFGARLGEQAAVAGVTGAGRAEDFGISVLFVAMGVGGVAGAPLARRFNAAGAASLGDRMGGVLLIDGCALALFSFMPTLWSAALALACREVCFATWWTAQQTLIMRRTEGRFAGRVFASFETLTTLAMVSSMLVSGAAADRFGMRPVAFLGGLTVALSGASWFLLRRRAREAHETV